MPPRRVLMALVFSALVVGALTGVPPSEQEGIAVWRPALASDSIPGTVSDAERQGNRYPRAERAGAFTPSFREKASVGTSARECVDVADANSARSGDLILTPVAFYVDYWRQGAPPKLTVAMAHRPRIGEPVRLTIRASRIDGPAPSHVFSGEVRTYRWSAIVMAKLMRIQWRSAAVLDLPSSGRWLLAASMGENWGCFVLHLPTEPAP